MRVKPAAGRSLALRGQAPAFHSLAAVAEQFGRKRPVRRPASPQRLVVERNDGRARGGKRPLDACGKIIDGALTEFELTVHRKLDDHGAQQRIVRRLQRDCRYARAAAMRGREWRRSRPWARCAP